MQPTLADPGAVAAPDTAAISQRAATAAAAAMLRREAAPEDLKQAFREHRQSTIQRLYPLAKSWCREQLRELLPTLTELRSLADGAVAAFAEDEYLERVVHLALERLLINQAAPQLFVSPVPEARHTSRLQGTRAIALLFDYPLAITHELYPLWTDAYVFAQSAPEPSFEVIGVHVSWLDEHLQAQRAISFDPAADAFFEAPLEAPHPLAAALLLCQSRQVHRELSARLTATDLPHFNPYQNLAEVADDKWQCFERWERSGVATPPTCLLEQGKTPAAIQEAIRGFTACHHEWESGWMIQPRQGTEGEQLSWVPPDGGTETVAELFRAWEGIAGTDDAILRPRVGSVGLQAVDQPEPLPFDLRLNVSFDGVDYRAESGYLLVAPGPNSPISSLARGGQIEPFFRLEESALVCADASARAPDRIPWTREELDKVRQLAIRSVAAVAPLALAGVDIKLDYQAGSLAPSVLDVNPRPAGLLHADLFDPAGGEPTSGEAGIASGLWRRVGATLRTAPRPDADRS